MEKKGQPKLHLQVTLLVLCTCIWGCYQDYPMDELPSLPSGKRSALEEARAWYDARQQSHETYLSVATRSGNGMPFCSSPSWGNCCQTENALYTAFEVDMTDRIQLDFVMAENRRAYEETGEHRYRRSYTRLVILTEKSGGRKTGFLMTLMPSVKFIRQHGDRIRRMLYLRRDACYDGLVLYHNLDGSFSNGCSYRDGKVVGSMPWLPSAINTRSSGTTDSTLVTVSAIECDLMPCTYTVIPDTTSSSTMSADTTTCSITTVPDTTSSVEISLPDSVATTENPEPPLDGGELEEVVVVPEVTPNPPVSIVIPIVPGGEDDENYGSGGSSGQGGGSGGGSGGGGSAWTCPTLERFYDSSTSNLNDYLKSRLDLKLAEFSRIYPKIKEMYNDLAIKGIKIGFQVNPSKTSRGSMKYDEKKNIIYLYEEGGLISDGILEEIVHVAQYHAIYKNKTLPSLRNIEFEAKTFCDLNCQATDMMDCGIAAATNTGEYWEFLGAFEKKPKFNEEMLNLYHIAGKAWIDVNYPESNTGPYDPLSPPLLIERYFK